MRLYICTVFCKVVPLRAHGRVLTRSELPAPVEGRLVLSDWGPPCSKRWKRKAEVVQRLWNMDKVSVMAALLDPVLARVDETGLYLMGQETKLSKEDGAVYEFVQVWHIVPLPLQTDVAPPALNDDR